MGATLNSGSSSPGSNPPETPRSDRELAVKMTEYFRVDPAFASAITTSLEAEIKGMEMESKYELERWVKELEHIDAAFVPGRLMSVPHPDLLAHRMRHRHEIAENIHGLIQRETNKALEAMRKARGIPGMDDSAFLVYEGNVSERQRIGSKIDSIEERLAEEKPLTWNEVEEFGEFLKRVLQSGIKTGEDVLGATRTRVQYLLTSVESRRSTTEVAARRAALANTPGGRILIENEFVTPEFEAHPDLLKNRNTEPIRDGLQMSVRAGIFLGCGIVAILGAIPVIRKLWHGEPPSLADAWPVVFGIAALSAGGMLPKSSDELNKIRSTEQTLENFSPEFMNSIMEPAARASVIAYTDRMQTIYAHMGGKENAANAADDLQGIMQDRAERLKIQNAVRARSLSDTYIEELAGGKATNLYHAMEHLPIEDRAYFLAAMENLEIWKPGKAELVRGILLREIPSI